MIEVVKRIPNFEGELENTWDPDLENKCGAIIDEGDRNYPMEYCSNHLDREGYCSEHGFMGDE